jgi:hypothetical protein
MQNYYLRIEAVNLNNFIYELGLALREVTSGASTGLFVFDSDRLTGQKSQVIEAFQTAGYPEPAAGLNVVSLIQRYAECFLRSHSGFQHATIVVDVIPCAAGSYRKNCESAMAANRWRQMGSLSTAVPNPGNCDEIACHWDGVRPAVDDIGGSVWISESVKSRRLKGSKENKRVFHAQWCGMHPKDLPTFTDDFEELATGGPGNLNRKIAVIHIDGNKFGVIQREVCKTEQGQENFDRFLQDHRRELFRTLLREFATNSEWHNGEDLRFETLVWGGDEMTWVVPAWTGMQLLLRFYELCRGWTYPVEGGMPLHHSAGFVFCHHKAPIHRVVRLAEDLIEIAKGVSSEPHIAYAVLESFDHLGVEAKGYLAKHIAEPLGLKLADLVLTPSGLEALRKARPILEREEMPKRKLMRAVRERFAGHPAAAADARRDLRSDVGVRNALIAVTGISGGEGSIEYHLAELWDYLR